MRLTSPSGLVWLACAAVLIVVSVVSVTIYQSLGRDAETAASNFVFNEKLPWIDRLSPADRIEEAGKAAQAGTTTANTSYVSSIERKNHRPNHHIQPRPDGSCNSDETVYAFDGDRVYGFWTSAGPGICIFFGERISPHYQSVYRAIAAIVASGLFAIIALAWAALAGQRQLQREIATVAKTCAAIGSGDLERRIPEDLSSHELQAIARQVNIMVGRLETLVLDVKALSRTLAHDMRNYIVHARLQLQRAADADDNERRAALDGAISSIQLLDRVSVEIARLTQAKSDIGKSYEPHDLAETAKISAALFADACDDEGIALELETASAFALVNPTLLVEVVNNLISNAIKYGGNLQAAIHIATSTSDGRAKLIVSDRGPGIPDASKKAVFKLNTRLDRDKAKDGQGFGLTIAALFTEMSGGTITVEDAAAGKPNPGARFIVSFPSVEANLLA